MLMAELVIRFLLDKMDLNTAYLGLKKNSQF